MKIGELAEKTGVSIDTIRFYERRGLIPAPSRRESGYRIYSVEYADRIRFIKRGQELGFTLKEVDELLSLRMDEAADCAEVQRQAATKLKDVEEKIRDLERVRGVLRELASACRGTGPLSDCPILDALEHGGEDHE